MRPALERSLADLQLASLDLYLIHWPVAHRHGGAMPASADELIPLEQLPLADTWAAMEELGDAGLVRQIGVSNFSAAKLAALLPHCRIRPAVNQVELHPWLHDPVITAIAAAHGVSTAQVLIAWGIARGTTVIPKSVRAEQIAGLDRHHRFVDGSFFVLPGGPYSAAAIWDEAG